MTEPNKPLEQMTAQERLALGRSYYNKGKLDEAIKACSSIRREEVDSETYAWTQYDLGDVYKSLGKLDEAIKIWSNISHKDNRNAYAWAQYSLGLTYAESGNLDQAIKIWSNISHKDNRNAYTWAQYSLGLTYKKQGNLDQAIKTWSTIHHEEVDSEIYAQAQLSLGAAYYAQEDWEQAIETLSNIHHEKVDSEIYAQAQLGLGAAYAKLGERQQAIETLSNIRREKIAPGTYAQAQYNLGEVYSLDKATEKQSHEAYDNVRDFSYYKSERGFKILKCPVEVRKNLHTVADNTDEVLKYLQIIPGFESKVAHYSRASTAFSLFGDEKNSKEPSHFRLSTIRGVNDPTEGLVLGKYWAQQGISETIHTNDAATFISCFTFNHDSLNQFRLYGKEDGQEATGVSLVFKEEFFSDQSDSLEFIAAPSIDPSSKLGQNSSEEIEKPESNNKRLIGKSTLYRCIYLDPETGYWTLAQRDKSTFYRQYKGEAKEKWEKYYESIPKKDEIVEKYLFAEDNKNKSVLSILKSISKELEESNAPEESHTYSIEEKQKILEAVRFILLPLQYLVKHIAFQEEQECRIMYITQFRDEKIHSDREEQKMYVEYEEPVLPHIDKIWLSPGAAKDQDFFCILLDQGSGKSKVRISQNPFRNKE